MDPAPGASWSVAATVVIVIGAFLRLARLDLIEFKGDEQEALNLGIRLLENPPWTAAGELPQHGMPSSQGIANAPLFNWVMAAAWALTGHPIGATALIGAANAAALYPLWRWALRHIDRERALLLLATVAVSPFSVLLSRKLWAQDLLFPALVCLLWAIEYWQTRRLFRAIACFAVAALPIGQLHQSGPIALAVFPVAVALSALGDRQGLRDRLRDLTSFTPPQYALLLCLVVLHAVFWIPYLEYLWTLPASVFANRLRLEGFEPALLRMVGQQVAPLDLFYFFAPDRADFLASGWRRFAYYLSLAFGTPLLIIGLVGWIRSPGRLPIAGVWWWLVIATFTLARIPAYPFYALILSPLPAALAAGAFDGRLPAVLTRTLLLVRWTYVVALLLVTIATGAWLSERGGARGDYGVVYGVREQQARALAGTAVSGALTAGLRCHEPPGEVLWIMERVHHEQAAATRAVCDGWVSDGRDDRYRWSVRP